MECIENRTFDELKLGETASLVRTLTYKDIELFAIDVSGAIVLTGRSEALGWAHVFDEDNHKHA